MSWLEDCKSNDLVGRTSLSEDCEIDLSFGKEGSEDGKSAWCTRGKAEQSSDNWTLSRCQDAVFGANVQSCRDAGAYIKVPRANKGRFLIVLEEIIAETLSGALLLVVI